MFIALEGLDGSGKTTLAALLAQQYAFEKVTKRTPFFKAGVHDARYHAFSPHNLHIAFLMAFGETSNRLVTHRLEVPHFVTRWLAGELFAYHLHVQQLHLEPLRLDYQHLPILMPDVVFYLKPSFDVRLRRLYQRQATGHLDDFDKLTMTVEAEQAFANIMTAMYEHYHIIDTDQSPQAACQQIVSILNLGGGTKL